MTNQESYFCEKEEKCHQKGSADNPKWAENNCPLADQPGTGGGQETSCNVPRELQLSEAAGG